MMNKLFLKFCTGRLSNFATYSGYPRRMLSLHKTTQTPPAAADNFSSSVETQPDYLTEMQQLPLTWLRDCCQCPLCMHKITNQRSQSNSAITSPPFIKSIRTSSLQQDSLEIIWNDEHHSSYQKTFVKQQFNQFTKYPSPKLWTALSHSNELSMAVPASALKSADGIKEILLHLLTYGFVLISGIEANELATLKAVSTIAKPFDSIYGIVSTFTSDEARSDTAYTTLPIAPHTDLTYYQVPLRLMALHCIERNAATVGGASMFVDGFEVARQLREIDEKLYTALFEIPQEFCYVEHSEEKHYALSCVSNVLCSRRGAAVVCEPRELLRVRFNMYDRGFTYLGSTEQQLQQLHSALAEYQRLTLLEENQWQTTLQPGTLAVYDNWRVLHARTKFEGRRVLTSAYVAEEEFSSALSKFGVCELGVE